MSARRGIVLFAHGSRDPQWARPLERLAETVRARDPAAVVELAFLELMAPDLETAIRGLAGQGVAEIAVLPVFWAAAGHVQRDVPRMLERARAEHPRTRIALLPVLSELPGVLDAIAAAALYPAAADSIPEGD